ncbi:MAG TPA: ABC transporter ATP-binding protein [Candidatus Saccharibacteria bacterium]|nr:ABC transporter ATP-binding protein [Candidatus Saccharibacteria bacterium]
MKHIFGILRYTKNLWRYYVAIGVFTVGLSILNLLLPMLSGWAIDEMRKGTSASVRYVVLLAVAIFLLDFFSNIFGNISGFLGDRMSTKLSKQLSERYFEHILTLPQSFFDKELSGKIISRLSRSVVELSNFVNMMSNNFLQFIFSTIFALAVVAFYSWQVAVMLFLLYPIYILMTIRTSTKWQDYQHKINSHVDIAAGRFAEAINQIKVVKSFNQDRRELGFFKGHYKSMVDIERPQSILWHKTDTQRRIVLNIIFFGVYLYVFVQGARGVFSPGQAVALILYAMQIRIPIFTISFLVDRTQHAISNSKDYFEIMNTKPLVVDRVDARAMVVTKGQISFENVGFGYDKGQSILKKINFTVEPDTKVALVGESGEGKTTLTNLLLRLYEPQTGTIKIDDVDIQTVTQHSLRANIGVVFQDPALFSGTIRENIGYANPKATSKEITAAAKAANAHDFIEKLEKGYETEIGERGLKLSGGQKQRIAIARALLKDAPILVLDEATSSLDSKSEHLVQDALERLMKGRTTIIIAHRLSTIQNVDQIITLQNGSVSEVGTPGQLADSGGIYAQLLALQRGHTDASKKKLKAYEIAA